MNIPPLKSFITIQGAGADKTIVQWGDTAKTLGPRGQPLGTYASASFAVNSPYFIAKNITFKVRFFDFNQISCIDRYLLRQIDHLLDRVSAFFFCFNVMFNAEHNSSFSERIYGSTSSSI